MRVFAWRRFVKSKGFSLIEVMAAVALMGLLVIFVASALGSGYRQGRRIESRKEILRRAENAAECALAYEESREPGIMVTITPYDPYGDMVEVYSEETGEKFFSVYRPKEGIYAP